MKLNIILIGMRGSGKSTFGKQLATRLNKKLVETDALVEKLAKQPISKIVKEKGWSHFRALEKQVCKLVCAHKNSVIATGGGMITDPTNRKLLENAGFVVYLKADAETLIARIKSDTNRPLLTSAKTIEEDVKQVLIDRQKIYKQMADIILESNNLPKFNKTTKLCAVFGNPVDHSLSPTMHNAALQKMRLDFHWIKIHAFEPKKIIDTIRLFNIDGAAITIPFKESIIPFLDHVKKDAREIGATNTIIHKNGKLIGANTDWIGFLQALEEKTTIQGKQAVILGAGGAARAILYGLQKKGAKVIILNRTIVKAKKLARNFSAKGWGSLKNAATLQQADIIINTTPQKESPINASVLHKNQLVFDIVYSPKETKFLTEAKTKGVTIVYGYKMLLYQGVEQFKLFTGIDAPIEIMEKALC